MGGRRVKIQDGVLAMREITELEDADYGTFEPLVEEVSGLLTEDDVRHLTSTLENNSSAGLMLSARFC
jgi:hypothetical protein